MYKIAVLGPYDSIYGFAMLGFDTVSVSDPKTGIAELKRLAEEEYAVIYITEGLAATMQSEIDKYKEQLLPTIILIPGIAGNTGMGVENVKRCVEQAVGSDILFSE
ncbi:MAG: V-type ATP synthase subunit F [Eubacterium sp.]|nr:V-type ATP synthase subunit F [Eubacterium sp.]